MSERRREKRFEVCLDVVLEGDAINRNARVADLSETGCYIDSIAESCAGEMLEVKIKLPSGEWIQLMAEVAHYTPRLGIGLRFIEPDPTVRDKIRSLLRDLRRRGSLMNSRLAS